MNCTPLNYYDNLLNDMGNESQRSSSEQTELENVIYFNKGNLSSYDVPVTCESVDNILKRDHLNHIMVCKILVKLGLFYLVLNVN